MRDVTVRLFGGLELGEARRPPVTFPTRRAQSLFAFLALNQGRFFSRDALCGTFWAENSESYAKKGLRTELWRIRQALEASAIDPGRLLHADSRQAGMPRSEAVWVDAREFERRTRILTDPRPTELDPGSAESLHRATRLYRGELLEGIYDDWCCQERERFQLVFLSALERLTSYHERNRQWRQAIARACNLLRHDPLREHVHRQIMRCHYAMGNRPSAIQQYRRCVETLKTELDVDPMEETRFLFDCITKGRALGFVSREDGPDDPSSSRARSA